MRKLPEGEAKHRHDERNRMQNEARKAEVAKRRAEEGKGSKLTQERKNHMKEYTIQRRAVHNAAKAERLRVEKAAKQLERDGRRSVVAALTLAKKLAREKLKRAQSKVESQDMRGKYKRPVKPAAVKPVKPVKLKMIRKEKPEAKPMVIRKIDTSVLIPLKLDAKTTIYVKPGTDIEATRQRFLARKI